MELEQLVTSLEMSQKLVDAGFEAETPSWWIKGKNSRQWELVWSEDRGQVCDVNLKTKKPYVCEYGSESGYEDVTWDVSEVLPAYTFQQLGTYLHEKAFLQNVRGLIPEKSNIGLLLIEMYVTYRPDTAVGCILWGIENDYLHVKQIA